MCDAGAWPLPQTAINVHSGGADRNFIQRQRLLALLTHASPAVLCLTEPPSRHGRQPRRTEPTLKAFAWRIGSCFKTGLFPNLPPLALASSKLRLLSLCLAGSSDISVGVTSSSPGSVCLTACCEGPCELLTPPAFSFFSAAHSSCAGCRSVSAKQPNAYPQSQQPCSTRSSPFSSPGLLPAYSTRPLSQARGASRPAVEAVQQLPSWTLCDLSNFPTRHPVDSGPLRSSGAARPNRRLWLRRQVRLATLTRQPWGNFERGARPCPNARAMITGFTE